MPSTEPPRIVSFGASVTGPAHRRAGLPNQDAWHHAALPGGRVVVASDGLGSRPHSEIGARAACHAGVEALRIWLRHPTTDPRLLCALIQVLWLARLPPEIPPGAAAATCLLLYCPAEGPGVAAQLGDGLLLLRQEGAPEPLTSRPLERFGNETQALGISRAPSDWTTRILSPGPLDALLCTDGVSDDLIPERYGALLDWLTLELLPTPPGARWRALTQALRDWDTPGHTDDKTLCVLRRRT